MIKKHLLVVLALVLLGVSCKKDGELKSEEIKISAITFNEAKAYVKSKERELPFVPNWAKSQYTVTKDNYIVRAPLKGTYGTLYLFKDRKGTIKGSIFRLLNADSEQSGSNYTGTIIRYDIEDNQLQGLEMRNGRAVKNITYESQPKTTASGDKTVENVFERIWCWLSGDVYNGTSCIKTVREHPTSNDEGGSGGGGSDYFFEKTQDIPTKIVVSQENGYKPPVSWSSGTSSGGSSGPISNEEYFDGTEWVKPTTWDDYFDMPYEGAVWIMNNLKNEVTGEAIELYLVACYKESKIINLSAFGSGNIISKAGDYNLSPRYDNTGKLLFYAAYRNQQNGIEYVIKASDVNNFVNHVTSYTSLANMLYKNGIPTIGNVETYLFNASKLVSATALTNAVTQIDNRPIINPNNYINCFNDGKAVKEYKVTIFVDQPVEGKNDQYNVVSGLLTGYGIVLKTGNSNFDVGHSFVGFEKINIDGTRVTQVMGFYPSPESSGNSKGIIKDDSNHSYDVSYTISLGNKKELFDNALLKVISDYNNAQYVLSNLNNKQYNCTNAAVYWFNNAGGSLTVTPRGNFNGTPGDFGEDLRKLSNSNKTKGTAPRGNGSCK